MYNDIILFILNLTKNIFIIFYNLILMNLNTFVSFPINNLLII